MKRTASERCEARSGFYQEKQIKRGKPFFANEQASVLVQHILKHLRIGIYELSAIAIIVVATLLRIILTALGWPQTNSDEDIIGLMGMHIAYHGTHPIFYYGQNYMGSLEAYLAAIMFHLFGVSVFSLRLGLILIFALFLASTYLLTSLLYTKKLALFSIALLCLGSSAILTRQLTAIGGYPETLLFGSLAFLPACWLALSYAPGQILSPGQRGLRWAAYACWGCVVGLGLWSDLLILPFVLMSGLLLVLCCWREWHTLAPLWLILGLIIGGFPLIYYNLHAAPGQDSLTTLISLFGINSSQPTLTLAKHLQSAQVSLLVSLPMATGNPFCPVWELPFLGPNSPNTLSCTLIHATWGTGSILLWGIATMLLLFSLWKSRTRLWATVRSASEFPQERQAVVRDVARLLLLGSMGLAFVLFMFSSAPLVWPGIHARYLIGLLIGIPAALWPLWSVASNVKQPTVWREHLKGFFCAAVLVLIGSMFLLGMIGTFLEVPTNQAIDQQQEALVSHLIRMGDRHIYTDYWTCYRTAFQSDEQIICGVLDNNLLQSHNRYLPYLNAVEADPHTAYVFPSDSPPAFAVAKKFAPARQHVQHSTFEGYDIFQFLP